MTLQRMLSAGLFYLSESSGTYPYAELQARYSIGYCERRND